MSKGHRRRPYDQEKWSEGWDRTFGWTVCDECGARVRLHKTAPRPGARGEVGVLCRACQKEKP